MDGVVQRGVEGGAGEAERNGGDADAALVQAGEGGDLAGAALADQLGLGVHEFELGGVAGAEPAGWHLAPGDDLGAGDEKGADLLAALGGLPRDGHHDQDIRRAAERDVALEAVEHPLAGPDFGGRGQHAAAVAAGLGLGERPRREPRALEQFGEDAPVLRGAAGGEEVAGAEGVVRGDINGEGRLVFGEFADGEGVGRVAEALAAERARGRDAEEAELAGPHEGGARQLLRFFPRVGVRGDFGRGETRDLVEEGGLGRGQLGEPRGGEGNGTHGGGE